MDSLFAVLLELLALSFPGKRPEQIHVSTLTASLAFVLMGLIVSGFVISLFPAWHFVVSLLVALFSVFAIISILCRLGVQPGFSLSPLAFLAYFVSFIAGGSFFFFLCAANA
ncbi:hypothetical protein [Crenobacter cavernae]|uniref:hypothetical protein n=1 Tax=Crenobacter cavernae TaxID=2290923 RepID=UPI0011C067B7|nr:hypothetical protein [Crenobacter cavernae]